MKILLKLGINLLFFVLQFFIASCCIFLGDIVLYILNISRG